MRQNLSRGGNIDKCGKKVFEFKFAALFNILKSAAKKKFNAANQIFFSSECIKSRTEVGITSSECIESGTEVDIASSMISRAFNKTA